MDQFSYVESEEEDQNNDSTNNNKNNDHKLNTSNLTEEIKNISQNAIVATRKVTSDSGIGSDCSNYSSYGYNNNDLSSPTRTKLVRKNF